MTVTRYTKGHPACPDSHQRGAVMAEAVIAVPLFIFLIFMAVELMVISWRSLTLQFVATQVMRDVVTGMCADPVGNPVYCEDRSRRLSYAIEHAQTLSSSYGLGANPQVIVCVSRRGLKTTDCPDIEVSGGNVGTIGELVEISTRYHSPLLYRFLRLFSAGSVLAGPGGGSDERFTLAGFAVGRVEGRQQS